MDNLLPCPFCDDQLHLINHPVDKGIKGAAGDFVEHSKEQRCPLAHMSIPLSMWSRRAHLATPAANGPGEAVVVSALKTIAEFPVTNERTNLDAANMRRIAVNALLLASTPQPGTVTVPREPTEAMLDAAIAWRIALKVADSYSMRDQFADCYRAMLDAALRSGEKGTPCEQIRFQQKIEELECKLSEEKEITQRLALELQGYREAETDINNALNTGNGTYSP